MSVTKCFKLWKEESCTPRIADIDDDQEDSFIKGPQHVHINRADHSYKISAEKKPIQTVAYSESLSCTYCNSVWRKNSAPLSSSCVQLLRMHATKDCILIITSHVYKY